MKILEIISDTNIGGAGMLLVSRLRHSDRRRFETSVLLPCTSQLKSRFLEIGIPVWEMKGCHDRSLDVGSIAEIVRVIRRVRPALVNCHGCMSARVAAMLCGVPVRVYTRHCAYPVPKWQKHALIRSLQKGTCTLLSHHVIAVAGAARSNLIDMGIPKERISVIINGAERLKGMTMSEKHAWKEKLGIRKGDTVVGISARLEPCKDHATLLRAAERLHHAGRPCCFLILGDGSLREQLMADAAQKGLSSCILFVGFVKDVAPYVNLMDIHVNCSVGTETSSLAISEAMSLGIPTVASDYGGNPYMVRDGINGLLYPAGNDQVLAEQIARLCDSSALYAHLSHNARARFAQELNAEAMTKKTERLYARLYARQRSQSPKRELAMRK